MSFRAPSICSKHRPQVFQSSSSALNHWHLWMQRGLDLYHSQQYNNALVFFGCSFEVSEWLIQQSEKSTDPFEYLPFYLNASYYFTDCLGQRGKLDVQQHYQQDIHKRLQRLASTSTEKTKPKILHTAIDKLFQAIETVKIKNFHNSHNALVH